MEDFLMNRVVYKIGNMINKSIKLKMVPKIDIIMNTVEEQFLILDKDIDQSTAIIHNKIREQLANLPPANASMQVQAQMQ
jgi:MinD-like ATPase involved in chromosome partitioning or flagellar assembly